MAAAEPGSPFRQLAERVGQVAVDLRPVTVEPGFVGCLDLNQNRVQRRAVGGEPHEVRFPVAETGQLRLGDHRDRERAMAGNAVHAVRARQQRGCRSRNAWTRLSSRESSLSSSACHRSMRTWSYVSGSGLPGEVRSISSRYPGRCPGNGSRNGVARAGDVGRITREGYPQCRERSKDGVVSTLCGAGLRQIRRMRSRFGRLTALRNGCSPRAGVPSAETWEESVVSAVFVPRICTACGKANHPSWTAVHWLASREGISRGGRALRRGDYRDGWS